MNEAMAGESLFEKIEKIKMHFRILILVGMVVLLGGLFIYFVYIPKTTEIEKTNKSITKLNRRLNLAVKKSKKLSKLNAEKALRDTQYQEALRLLPNKKEIPNVLRKVTELGNDAKLEFRIFVPKREKKRKLYFEIPVAIEVRGGYHNVAVFFDKIGHMQRIMNIKNVSMRPVRARSTTLITKCTAVTYRLRGKASAKTPKKKKK
jgi:type IV pilus assembly protein PilO